MLDMCVSLKYMCVCVSLPIYDIDLHAHEDDKYK